MNRSVLERRLPMRALADGTRIQVIPAAVSWQLWRQTWAGSSLYALNEAESMDRPPPGMPSVG